MPDQQKEMTADELKDFVKSVVGPEFAAIKEENEKKGSEMMEKILARLVPPTQVTVAPSVEKGIKAARFVRAVAAGKGDVDRALAYAKQHYSKAGDTVGEEVIKALSTSPGTAGGIFVPTAWSEDWIEMLNNKAVVRSMGATVVPMPNGNLSIPKQTASSIAEYIGENQPQKASQPAFGFIQMVYRKLRVTVSISNDLLQFARPSADTMVRNDMVNAMRLKEDLTFIRSNGTQFSPKGLRYWAPAANIIPFNATANLANVTADLASMVLALEYANVGFTKPGWIFNPRVASHLMTVRDANGNFAFRPEMASRPGQNGTLWGFPYATTNAIPRNLGAGSNETEVYLVDFADAVIAESSDIAIEASTEAAYLDENGVLVSAFANDQTVIRAIARHDFGVRNENSVVVGTGVLWA